MKSTLIVSLITILGAVGCGKNDGKKPTPVKASEVVWDQKESQVEDNDRADLPHISAAARAATYQKECANPVSVYSRAGEIPIAGGIHSAGGKWELESLRTFHGGGSSGEGTVVAQYANGRALVQCHNSYESGGDSRSVNGSLTIPNEMDTDRGELLSEATLVVQARNGRVGAQMQLNKVQKALPRESSPFPGVQAELVRTADGKLILRFVIAFGPIYAAEAVYKPKK